MVGRKQKTRQAKSTLGNHQRSWIWGRHAVLETLRAGRWKPLELLLCPELLDPTLIQEIQLLLSRQSDRYEVVSAERIEQLTHARDHQGLAAMMPEFPLLRFPQLLERMPENAFLLLIDRIQDPYNFGSILRSADLFHVDGIIIGSREQAGISSHVTRSSAGAVNYLNIARVESLSEAARELSRQGVKLVAATEKGSQFPSEVNLTGRVAIVIGNEGSGIDLSLLEQCTVHCVIPQSGHIDSLNAAVAAGILCYEVSRQRTVRTGSPGEL